VGALGKTANKCTVDCAAVLLPLLKDCMPMLNMFYDLLDKKHDGSADVLTEAYEACLAIPATAALRELAQLQKKSPATCTDAVLNNVAKTAVSTQCKDRNTKCKGALAIGFIKCPAGGPGGQCDKTCNLCGSGSKGHTDCPHPPCHRRRTQLLKQRKDTRRRTQSVQSCNLQTFESDITRLNTFCCDDGACRQGTIPKVCDAKCAVHFVGFFDRCKQIIKAHHPPMMRGLTDLHNTCTTKLPVKALLEAVAKCRGITSGAASLASLTPSAPQSATTVTEGLQHT
jgi:hypothetical protein